MRYVADIEDRFMYNPTFESIYSMVPSIPALLLVLIPAILMAVSIVREKELGSMINFYVTPTRKLEYLIGKQLPYVLIVMANYFILVGMAVFLFGVPIKGSFLTLTACTFLYAFATTGIGMAVSSFTSSQVAAVFITAIVTMLPTLQFSGLMQPVSTLTGNAKFIGMIWPTTYYMHASVGAYTKGLHPFLIIQDMLFLAACVPVLWGISWLGLRKQEK
jgi:ribosome-dependent ATPase